MIGKIVLVLSVFCFDCITTQTVVLRPFPKFQENVTSKCDSYKPKAEFAVTQGISYVLLYSGTPYRCFTVTVKPVTRNNTLYGYTYGTNYFDPSDTKHTHLLTGMTTLWVENPKKPGQAQMFHPNEELMATSVVVGDEKNDGSSVGSAVFTCPLKGDKELLIMTKEKPPQETVQNKLKAQLKDNNLQDVPLKQIYQGSDCRYYWEEDGGEDETE